MIMENIGMKGNLTPDFINDKLGPFLDAIQNIQHTIDEIKQVSPSSIKVNEIRWEGIDTIENEVLSDMPRTTIFLSGAQKALAGLRETLDYLNEEPSNQSLYFASVRMAKSIYEALSVSIEPDIENFLATRDFAKRQYEITKRTSQTMRGFELSFRGSDLTIFSLPDESISQSVEWIEEINKREEK
jgi:hypothetical protein